MKYYLLFTLLIPFGINAQSLDNWVIGSGGEATVSSGIQISWTLGEPNTATINKNNLMITEGFHQSYLPYAFLPAHLPAANKFAFHVFPNPTANYVHINFDDNTARDFDLRLFDIHGKMLQYQQYKSATTAQLNLESLPASTYVISIHMNDLQPSLPQTFQIIKH
ncbi:MAG: T9SS type A sorting domain-containing protein [Saprospiraceae bacterium]|nr:T9SS type A sorting domain-containing protein [Saprospiraceae bacterium]